MGACANHNQAQILMSNQTFNQYKYDLDSYLREGQKWEERQQIIELANTFKEEETHQLFQSQISYNEEEIQQEQQFKLILEKLPKYIREIYDKYGPYQPPDQQIDFTIGANITTHDQSFYYGKIETNMKQGYGYHLTDNDFYEGYFKDNERNGWGRVINQNGYQSGFWQNGIIQIDNNIQKDGNLKEEEQQ